MTRKHGSPGSLAYDLGAPLRAKQWRECCASSIEHRFDCPAVPREQRGPGPFGPVR